LLHISYTSEIKKWQALGDQKKITKYEKTIQDLFKNEMGLLVDKVKPGGSGTPNNINTARQFFFF